ncbi:MAG: hypothetical protein ACHQAV_06480 [Solirubrobacterales bacterium]
MLRRGDRWLAAIAAACAATVVLAAPVGLAEPSATRSPRAAQQGLQARAARIPCRPTADSVTIAQSPAARLFTGADGNDYACLYSVARAFYLSGAEHYDYRLVHFSGPYVAYVQNIEASDDSIGEMDLRSGRLRTFQIATPINNSVCYGVGSLALKADGAVAWIGTNFLGFACISPPGPEIEVRRHDHRGLRILDRGRRIVPGSLHLLKGVLSWTDGGVRRKSTLD